MPSTLSPPPRFSVIIVAGGGSRRFGREDKLTQLVHGKSLLDWTLEAWSAAHVMLVVGPVQSTPRSVRFVREQPVGGGPVAAVGAALPFVDTELVGLGAGDSPLVGPVVSKLVAVAADCVSSGGDGAWCVDPEGLAQPFAAVISTAAIRSVVENPRGASIRQRLHRLELAQLEVASEILRDVDTPEDLADVTQLLAVVHGQRGTGPAKGARDE